MRALASAAPVQLNTKRMPRLASSQAPSGPRAPNTTSSRIADRHRRQHQRQMDDAVHQRLAAKAARQNQRRRERERQRHGHRNRGNLQAEQQRLDLVGRQKRHGASSRSWAGRL